MKKVNYNPCLGDNAVAIVTTFSKQARKDGWTSEQIDSVITNAISGDYVNLINIIASHCDLPHEDLSEQSFENDY